MNTSNLPQRLDEFAAVENEARVAARQAPQMFVVAKDSAARRAPPRLTLDTRRIQIRDSGLRLFRVY
jgi:hypothetical protein